MQIIRKSDLLKDMKKNSFIGVILMIILTGIFILVGFLLFDDSFLFSIVFFVISALLSIPLFKLIITNAFLSEKNISISKDVLLSKERKILRYGDGDNNHEHLLTFEHVGVITVMSSEYNSAQINQPHYLIYIKGDPNPMSIYNANEYELDSDLSKMCTDLT